MNKILKIDGITKTFDTQEIIRGIELGLVEGEITAILGPSGCGKTTLFRLIAGLVAPERGEIILRPGTRVGYVFQEPRLLPWKTVAENLNFVQQNFLSRREAFLLREELLSVAGLAGFKEHYPGQLSGGMKQRLELIRALSIKPDLLLLDEPFKSLDAYLRVSLREMLLSYWQREKLSVFMITHDPEEAVLMADRIIVLSRRPGQIIKEFRLQEEQSLRKLKDEKIYQTQENILKLLQMEAGKLPQIEKTLLDSNEDSTAEYSARLKMVD